MRGLPFAVVLATTLFLALRAHPSLQDVALVPRSLVRFFDANDFLNNVIGFGTLAAAQHFAFAGVARQPASRVARRAAIAAAGVVALEFVQLMLPQRSSDWHDVAAGWVGIAVASLPWVRPRGK